MVNAACFGVRCQLTQVYVALERWTPSSTGLSETPPAIVGKLMAEWNWQTNNLFVRFCTGYVVVLGGVFINNLVVFLLFLLLLSFFSILSPPFSLHLLLIVATLLDFHLHMMLRYWVGWG